MAQQDKYIHPGCLPSITIPLPVHHVSYIIHFVLAIVPCSIMLKVPQSIYSLFTANYGYIECMLLDTVQYIPKNHRYIPPLF